MRGILGHKLLLLLLTTALLGSSWCVYAQPVAVDKAEFNAKWQKAYQELKAIDPEAAAEFLKLTKEEFKGGKIKYTTSGQDKTKGTTTATTQKKEGTTATSSTTTSEKQDTTSTTRK